MRTKGRVIPKRYKILSAIFCLQAMPLLGWGMEVYLAPISTVTDPGIETVREEKAERVILDGLGSYHVAPPLEFNLVGGAKAPKTMIDAMLLCQQGDYEYLLYGYVRLGELSYSAELKLLDREAGTVVQTFFSADSPGHYRRLLEDLTDKIARYFLSDLGFGTIDPEAEVVRNLWALSFAAGYWSPLGGAWDEALGGIVTAEAGASLIPKSPTFIRKSSPWDMAIRGMLAYEMGVNEPGNEDAFLNSCLFRLGATVGTEISSRSRIAFGAGPSFRIDVVSLARKYADVTTGVTAVPAAFMLFEYEYALTDRIGLDLSLILDDAFYSTPMISLSPRVGISYGLGERVKRGKR